MNIAPANDLSTTKLNPATTQGTRIRSETIVFVSPCGGTDVSITTTDADGDTTVVFFDDEDRAALIVALGGTV